MKILYLSSGSDIHDYRFLKKSCEKGYDTYLVSYSVKDIFESTKRLRGLKIYHKKPFLFKKIQKYFYINRIFHFKEMLKKIKPDILFSSNTWNNGYLASLSGFHPHLLRPFGSDILLHAKKFKICHYFNQKAIDSADMIICDSEQFKKVVVRDYGYEEGNIEILPWGIELDIFHPGDSGYRAAYGWENKKVLIMNRGFARVYGISYFIEALPKVLQKEPDTRVFLLGEGPLGDELRRLVRKNNLIDIVKFIGLVPSSEVVKYLNASDIYVSTSLSDGTSLSLLETMACKLPVVVTDVPAIMEWVRDGFNGFVAPRRDVDSIAQKIVTLLRDKEIRRKMGGRNFQIAQEKADWEKNFGKIEKMYQKLIAKYGVK